MELLSGNSPAFKSMVSALRQKADGKEIKPVWQEAYRWFAVQAEWRGKCEALRAAFQYKNLAQPVSREKIAALYGEPAVSSVSRLENTLPVPLPLCAIWAWSKRKADIFFAPAGRGTFMHAVIEKFSRMVAKRNISWRDLDRDWCSEKVSEIVDEMLEKMQRVGNCSFQKIHGFDLKAQARGGKSCLAYCGTHSQKQLRTGGI